MASSLFFSDPGSTFRTVSKLLKTGGLEWWTRQENIRTLARLSVEVDLVWSTPVPVYQRIAADAAEMRARRVSMNAIAEHFGVDDHTAAKAVRWFHSEL